ncbi:nuclear transport factor 2 family protein [Flagellimonas myxillae]|uniref:nuclear transport factor 2 family protein n=1 Tax=Flagellimonas myxillae TaxID=2942214 RepID=UPI00201F8ABD|nr:nuclear transport factor 2 family protein [Muricauda myxillae]MCL6267794.1 nuclear transport factor 2 family protein [Muricauda myxillae]
MIRTALTMAVMVVFAACKQTETPVVEPEIVDEITKEEALDLLHTWTNAYLKGDAGPLIEVLDDSWVYSGSGDGSTSNKIATIDEFSTADYSFDEIKYHDLDVQLYGDVAVVRGWEKMVILGSDKQDTTILKLRFTDVYQKKEGKVRAIATHSSPME